MDRPELSRRRAITGSQETVKALEAARRKEALARLGRGVEQIQAAAARAREELSGLLARERTRRLTRDEQERVRELRWQCEALTYELLLLRERFEELRAQRATISAAMTGERGAA